MIAVTQEIIGDLYVSLYDLLAHAKALKMPHQVNLQIAQDALDAARQYIEQVEPKGSAQ